jgi:hypothetical protein
VPETGRRIKLDTYENAFTEFADADDLRDGLGRFLAKPETQDAINAYAKA